MRRVSSLKRTLVSKNPVRRLVKIENRYYWDFNQPGWPSAAFKQNIKWFISQDNKPIESVRLVFLAITKKCPMNCKHCFEWKEINKTDTVSSDELKSIVGKYQDLGAATFILGGGEPMSRFDTLLDLLRSARPVSEFWMSTSGFHLSYERAGMLKEAGLTGACISIDHFDATVNNLFRGHPKATEIALEAAKNCLSAGLGLANSICATREFISMENLLRYADFSKEIGSGFIWLIEPRAEGRWDGKDVLLKKAEYEILDNFYLTLNRDVRYKAYPRILFPNFNHRHIGCAGAGKSNIMIDTDGYINPCPFCRKQIVHALDSASENSIKKMMREGCFKYESRA